MVVSGCSSSGSKRDPADRPVNPFKPKDDKKDLLPKRAAVTDEGLRTEAQQSYRLARKALDGGEYADALSRYDTLIERYPFTEYATQAELEKIYAQQRDFKSDEALSAADRFLRDHPRHPRADYVQYLKGVIQSERDAGILQSISADTTKQDVSNLRKAYDEFSLLIQKYPNSRYDEDARLRMIDLRNRVAENEMHAVRYYIRRGAYLAASRRSEQIIAQYPGSPATLEALKVLGTSLRQMGLDADAAKADKLLSEQNGQRYVEKVSSTGAVVAPTPINQPLSIKPAGKPGIFTRFANLFSIFDTDKNPGYEVVIPTGGTPAATPSTAATADGTTTPTPAAAPAPKRSKLSISINTGDDEPAAKPAAEAPAAAPAADTTAKPAAPAPAAAPQKRGFLTRVVDFFSFLDPDKPAKQ